MIIYTKSKRKAKVKLKFCRPFSRGCTAPHISNIGCLETGRFASEEGRWNQLNRGLSGPHNRFGRLEEECKSRSHWAPRMSLVRTSESLPVLTHSLPAI